MDPLNGPIAAHCTCRFTVLDAPALTSTLPRLSSPDSHDSPVVASKVSLLPPLFRTVKLKEPFVPMSTVACSTAGVTLICAALDVAGVWLGLESLLPPLQPPRTEKNTKAITGRIMNKRHPIRASSP